MGVCGDTPQGWGALQVCDDTRPVITFFLYKSFKCFAKLRPALFSTYNPTEALPQPSQLTCSAPSNTSSIVLVPFPSSETPGSSFPLLGHPSHGVGPESPTLLSSTCKPRIFHDLFLNQGIITGRDGAGGTLVWFPKAIHTSARSLLLPGLIPNPPCIQAEDANNPNMLHLVHTLQIPDTHQDSCVNEIPQVLHRRSTPPSTHQTWGKAITEHRWSEIHRFPKVLRCNSPEVCYQHPFKQISV